MSKNSTIFDDVFRTMVEKMPRLVVPLINEVFRTDYPMNVEIFQERNENHEPDGEIITDSLLRIRNHLYHLECQSTDDTVMAIRMFRYDTSAAIAHGIRKGRRYQVAYPQSAVLYLRGSRETPDYLEVDVTFMDGFKHTYRIPAIKAYEYTKNEIFEKDLFFLLPFYVLRYEKQKKEIAGDERRLRMLLDEYDDICMQLEKKTESGYESLYTDLINLMIQIVDHVFAEEETVKGRFKDNMGGKVLELESERLLRTGKAEGKAEGEQRSQLLEQKMVADGRIEDLVKSTQNAEYRAQLYAEYGIL